MDKDTFLQALGEVIRQIRKEHGFSQEAFAEEVGVHRTYMGSVERGERNISVENLLKISDALNIQLSELIKQAERYN